MPMNALPAAILAHMVAIKNVPPPPLSSIPALKPSSNINYGQLSALCHRREVQRSRHSSLNLAAHNAFIKRYPQIFLHKKPALPKIPQEVEKRKSVEKIEEKKLQPDESHNIGVYIRQAHGGPSLYEEEKSTTKFQEFLDILKKLPVHRTIHEHNCVWSMLKKIPELASQLSDAQLKILSKKVVTETWIKGSTVIGNDGLYIILKGLARPRVKVVVNLFEDADSIMSTICTEGFIFDADLKDPTKAEIYLPSVEIKEKAKHEDVQMFKLIRKCPFYEKWPTLYIYDLVAFSKWKIFPPGHVLVESGTVISFVGFINSGYCDIYRNVVGLVRLQLNKVKKVKKLVYMGKLKEKTSFGEISVLLQSPFTCTIITGQEVEMTIIEDKDIFMLDPVIKELMIQTAKPTFGHLTDEDVKNKYIQKVQQKEWRSFKNKTLKRTLDYNGVLPGFGKWEHYWKTIPRNLKNTLVSY